MKNDKKVFGTYEWAVENANFINGCYHNCKYCYSKEMAIRFKRKTTINWEVEEINEKQLNKKLRKIEGYIMFPSSHDITPKNFNYAIEFLGKLLNSDNKVLIVTKPHIQVIKEICNTFSGRKEQILFRFTIGSNNSKTLKFWEPNAPSFEERKECLKYAFNSGFSTSVSCEPMLDSNVEDLIQEIEPFITNAIWIGKANFLLRRLKMNGVTDKETLEEAHKLIEMQSDTNIKQIYKGLAKNPKVKWKESIKKIVNIEITSIKGLDK